ncbi:hypothetical protein [Fontivita pretiosa]|uniref:hypothetical protein n=1 Tax=Fontivita pretiosa TaxID=2989684 RepID=UPI003D17ACF7
MKLARFLSIATSTGWFIGWMAPLAVSTLLPVVVLGVLAGCRDNTPPPPQVPVPTSDDRRAAMYQRDEQQAKPLPPPSYADPSHIPPFDDVPLVSQQPPEQHHFVDAYRRVGSPRIVVFVNRTLEGNIIPVNPEDPLLSVEHTRRSSTGVTVESRQTHTRQRGWRDRTREYSDRYESKGPGEYRETTEVYLHPGQYDEAQARALDYQAIENIMTDWLAANGQVTVISPMMARQRLSDQQVKELQEGRPQVLSELAQQLNADVLVQVQARPTRQTQQGLEVRIVAEALNTRGGESIGRAVVDVPPPLEKTQINDYTRYLARKLMSDMTQSWTSPPPQRLQPPAEPQAPAPTAPPATQP